MGCGCGKNKQRGTQAFTLKTPDGKTTVHPTKMAAEAENVRRGGNGKVMPKR